MRVHFHIYPGKSEWHRNHTLVLLKKLPNHLKAKMGKTNSTILRNVPMTLQNWKNYYYLLILKTEILKMRDGQALSARPSLFFSFHCSTTNALANYSSSVIVIVQLWHSQCAPASLLPLTPACTLT